MLTNSPFCAWRCPQGLSLPHNGLRGVLSREMSQLTSLRSLDLSDNDLKSSIVSDLAELSNLQLLDLSYNGEMSVCCGGVQRLLPTFVVLRLFRTHV